MSALKSLAALSIASMSFLPSAPEVKADVYEKGLYGSIGAGAGTFSDLLLIGTPFALNFSFVLVGLPLVLLPPKLVFPELMTSSSSLELLGGILDSVTLAFFCYCPKSLPFHYNSQHLLVCL